MMGPDAAMAGAALADMARKWANNNPGFGQNMENAPQLPLLIDLLENENQYLLTADVPGLQKSDLKVCTPLFTQELSHLVRLSSLCKGAKSNSLLT